MLPGQQQKVHPVAQNAINQGTGGFHQPGPSRPTDGVENCDETATLIEVLKGDVNDLEPPARALSPVISTALAALEREPGCRLARMSGSGATVFGLFDTCHAAAAAARGIKAAHPDFWVKPTVLR